MVGWRPDQGSPTSHRGGFADFGQELIVVLELCNECHPFFTGKQKLVDTGGRVERFNKRYGERTNAPARPE